MHSYLSANTPQPQPQQPAPDVWLYLSEISHRTLNDYAVLLSMLRHASPRMSDAGVADVIECMANRLYASADVQRALSRPRDSRPRLLVNDLQPLCEALTRSLLADRKIHLSLICVGPVLIPQQCWQLSLVVSELVMNAARHAFASQAVGRIVVDIRIVGERLYCIVADNGAGCAVPSSGRGTEIVDAIAAELGGTVKRQHRFGGSTILLDMPYISRDVG